MILWGALSAFDFQGFDNLWINVKNLIELKGYN